MRILVVGAGAIGGYFGGRLLAAGKDVTFLVRPRRAEVLRRAGLIIDSPLGGVSLPDPPLVTSDGLNQTYDLVLLSCKAYDLEDAMRSIAEAVGPDTAILPLLNGMRHLETLDDRFGRERVLGGLCQVSTTLDSEGRILHFNDFHLLIFGERDGGRTDRIRAVEAALSNAGFDARLSEAIIQEMWEKWVAIATTAGMTCLMRAPIGDIIKGGGSALMIALLDECFRVAERASYPPSEKSLQRLRTLITAPDSLLAASMMRDIERHGPTEGDHIIGDLLAKATVYSLDTPLLRIAYTHLKTYEARRHREAQG